MHAIFLAMLAVVLFVPANVLATEIHFRTALETESISFGLVPFSWTGPIDAAESELPFDGSIALVSGPLLDLVVAAESSIYTYGPGTLMIDASWQNPDGSLGQGTFEGATLGFSLRVCEGCDELFGGSLADDFDILLGPGIFDDALARLLGVSRNTNGGMINFGLEAIDGDPSSNERQAFDHRGSVPGVISATAPEPGLLALGLTSGAVWVMRRRRSQGHRGVS